MSDLKVQVRAAEPDDGPSMATAHVAAWQVGYEGIVPADYLDALDVASRSEAWTAHLADPQRHYSPETDAATELVAVADKRAGAADGPAGEHVAGIASYGSYRTDDPLERERFCELRMLNVHPDFWGTGVAQALMERIVASLAERAEPTAALWVLERNARGRRFYEKQGWGLDGVRKVDTIGGADLVELRYVRPL